MQSTIRSRLMHRLGRKRLVVLPNDPQEEEDKMSRFENRKIQQSRTTKLVAFIILVILGGFEIYFLGETVEQEPTQLDEIAKTQMKINLNITFDRMLCEECRLHLMDQTGRQILDTSDTIQKTPLDKTGKPLLKRAYTRMDDFIPPHDLTRVQRFARGEGCNLVGHLHTYRTVGNFHVAMGPGMIRPDGRLVHQMNPLDQPNFKVSHTIHYLRLDEEEKGALDGHRFHIDATNGTTALVQYFLSVIPRRHQHDDAEEGGSVVHEHNRYMVNDTKVVPLFSGKNLSPMTSRQNVNAIIPAVFFIMNMHHLTEVEHKEEFGVSNIIRPLFVTLWIVVLLLLVDEAFFGARRKLLEERPRARILEIV